MKEARSCSRRRLLQLAGAAGLAAGLGKLAPAYAGATEDPGVLPREGSHDLSIRRETISIGGRAASATAINGSVPGPLVRLREGETAVLRVTNHLDEDSSLHWHGLLLPNGMDGVPHVTYPGIKPGETFTYRYKVRQSGTYWYHSHSGLQEQSGVYGPLVIEPARPDPFQYDRDYVVMLSDWTFEDPRSVLAKLKKHSGYYNYQRRTVGDFFSDAGSKGLAATLSDRLAWGRSRMDPTDISDVTGYTYTFLVNGLAPASNWTALFKPRERVRLRFINGSAMTYFDVRIPGLSMTVVQADGQNIEPVTVDEFRIAVAETYDVIVEPREAQAHTLFAEAIDRSGYARGTLAPREGMSAAIPARRPRPLRTMADMGMDMSAGGMAGMDKGAAMPGMKMTSKPAAAAPWKHGPDHHGPGNSMVAMTARSRLGEPGDGLENTGTRVLVYQDLRSLAPGADSREPGRELELHLTGNMDRYMWSFDGKKFSEVNGPIPFKYGERLRLTLVNDTMMDHPIHLHGMFMELDTGPGTARPRKHTVSVQPGEKLSVLISADAPGQWAFHCHLLYHMEMGMFRVVSVSGGA